MRDMFTRESPARSILELLEAFNEDGTEGFLFRGQTRDFPFMAPSAFRQYVTGGSTDGSRILLTPRPRPDPLSLARSTARVSVHERLVGHFGRAIGNVVAQQYGLSSDIIDVTSDLRVAAFFGTRTYPRYEHLGTAGEPGVVYRFKHRAGPYSRDEPDISLDRADIMGGLVGAHDRGINSFFWFNNYKMTDYGDSYLNRQDEQPGPGQRMLPLHSMGFGLSWANITALWASAQETYTGLRAFDVADTRLGTQVGGQMRPVYLVDTMAPKNIEASYNTLIRSYFSTQLVRVLRTTAIDNMATNPHVERFYFRHTPERAVDLTPEQLWPDANSDPLYRFLLREVETHYAGYLNHHRVAADDFNVGLLDRGFLA